MEWNQPELSIGELRHTRSRLQAKLRQLNKRLSEEPSAHHDSVLTFGLAERNFIQGNLERIERQLLLSRVMKSATRTDRVGIGNIVYIQCGSEIRAIMVIPATDADPNVEYVSDKSVLGKALLGKRKGRSVAIKLSNGKQNYSILRVE